MEQLAPSQRDSLERISQFQLPEHFVRMNGRLSVLRTVQLPERVRRPTAPSPIDFTRATYTWSWVQRFQVLIGVGSQRRSARQAIDPPSGRGDIFGRLITDVSRSEETLAVDLTKQQAMKRFHVRANNGLLLSGAAAFVAVWSTLPRWRLAARLAALPGILRILEVAYRLFLPVRPAVSGLFGLVHAWHRSDRRR